MRNCVTTWCAQGSEWSWVDRKMDGVGIASIPSICRLYSLCASHVPYVTWCEQPAPSSPARALTTCQLECRRLRTHLGRARKMVNQSHSEKVIKISNVFYKPSASPEFSMQLLSHSLGASKALQRAFLSSSDISESEPALWAA